MPDDKKINPKVENPIPRSLEKSLNIDRNTLERIGSLPEKEKDFESLKQVKKETVEDLKKPPKISPTVGIGMPVMTDEQKQKQKEIEKILETGLDDLYLNMPPEKQREFKRVGEETAKAINKLLEKAKIKVKEIVKLILKWLSIIPGVNKYFLEQEAKIKAEEVLKLKK